MTTYHPNTSSLPLLSEETITTAQTSLESLGQASAALSAGKLPSSDQLATIVQKLLKSNILQPGLGSRVAGKIGGGKLSPKGEELVASSRGVLEALTRLGLEKNDDDKIQRFIWAASHADADVDIDVNAATPDIPLPTSEEITEANNAIKQLASLLLTSTNLRDIVSDLVNLGRDLFADAAEQVANASIQTTKASKRAAKKARGSEEERKRSGVEQMKGVSPADVRDAKKSVVRGLEDKRDEAVDKAAGKAKEIKEWAEESLPTDAHDAFIERFKSIINEVQSSPEYQNSLNTLLGLVRKYASAAGDEIKKVAKSVEADGDISTNAAADNALTLLRQIIESFTGPLDSVFSSADKVVTHLKKDERLKKLVNEIDALADRAINDAGYATSSKAQRKIEQLYNEAQEIAKNNAAWKRDADALVDEVNAALDNAANDKALLQLGDAVDRFEFATKQFVKTGFSLVDTSAWSDISQVLVPRLLGALHTIPLPRVEFTSADVDLIIDNVRFTSDSFIPDAMFFKNHNEGSVKKGYAAYASEFTTSTTVSFSGLRLQAKDISYYIKKKTGWIGLEDYGLLDIDIGGSSGDGLDVTITVENAEEEDRETFFKVKKVDVAIDGFNLSIHDSQHYIRNWFARPALRGYIEKQLIQVLEEQTASAFKSADKAAYELSIKSAGAYGAAPDPLAFLRGIFYTSPLSASPLSEVTSTGVTKIGPQGEWILSVGVEEELLPGRRTGLAVKDSSDVVSRKRALESLAEEGRNELEAVRDQVEGVVEEVGEEADRIKFEAQKQRKEEARRNGWRSQAFDL
ncbi:Proteophosphoglycan ppg4 [Leucosporidium creatinivorum]|uniref:Proteophosphoglycan ppg4 n=1 Tax=Leucosporidium creatinivorum TaxID=106004 RepID=A0A1Y2EX91_9BASI|nr:Proteophosphoglycan ppg4 [Leucosporidium creatinivorum]